MAEIFFRIDFSSGEGFGPGKSALLDAIERAGSISAGARALGMSYRRAWLLADSIARLFHRPVLEIAQGGRTGGGARLTPFGRELVRRYRGMERRIARVTAVDRATLERLARPRQHPAGKRATSRGFAIYR